MKDTTPPVMDNPEGPVNIREFLVQERLWRATYGPPPKARGLVNGGGLPLNTMIPLRDENPTGIKPIATTTLIALSVVVFFWQLSLGPQGTQEVVFALGVIPAVLLQGAELPPQLAVVPPTATIFTSMFLHGGWMHIIGNMLYLWIFGDNVEDSMGHGRFVAFYLLSGTAAVFAQALPDPSSTIPMIGASGAISGVLGAYLLLFPHARVLVAIPFGFYIHTVHLPAAWVLGFWFLLQLISSVATGTGGGGVAFGAHVGGFAAGMAMIPFFKYRRVRLFQPRRGHR